MREIQFRGKNNLGYWACGQLQIITARGKNYYYLSVSTNPTMPVEVLPETICQYVMTIKGQRIYEKDVLIQWGNPYVVEWQELHTQQGYFIEQDDPDLEIIGNIIDTPDILKKYEK